MSVIRILVTASRDWPADMADAIEHVLDYYLQKAIDHGMQLQVVHGGARGGDTIADRWAHRRRGDGKPVLRPERWPARWHDPCRESCAPGHRRQDRPASDRPGPRTEWTICPMQGFYRNDYMVSLGADICAAFIYNGSRGARQCARAAEDAGIRTVRVERWGRTMSPTTPG